MPIDTAMKAVTLSRNDRFRIKGIRENKVFIGPKHAGFHLTNFCNLKCLYCWHHSALSNVSGAQKPVEMNFRVFKKAVDDCLDLKVEYIHLSARGEPTLHSRIIDMVGYLKEKGLRVCLYTNGTFGEKILKQMRYIDEVHINLSAANPEDYRSLQSLSSRDLFAIVLENIQALRSLKGKYGRPPHIRLHCILNSMNYRDIPSIFMLAYKLKVDFLNIVYADVDQFIGLGLKGREAEVNRIMEGIKNEKYFSGVKSSVLFNYRKRGQFMNNAASALRRLEHCYMAWYSVFTDINGNVSPLRCGAKRRLVSGNIYRDSLKNIWNSRLSHFIRLKGKYGCYGQRLPECINCCEFEWNMELSALINKLGPAPGGDAHAKK